MTQDGGWICLYLQDRTKAMMKYLLNYQTIV